MTINEPEIIELQTSSGPMRTLVLRPTAGGKYPGILLFSEIFQITGPIHRTAAFLAGHGFVVAIPEIYHEFEAPGVALSYDQGGADRGNTLKITKELSAYDSDARAVLDYLAARPDCTGKLGTLGICIGGHLAFRASMNADVLAGVCFYATDIHKRGLGKGTHDNSLDRIKEIKGEMLMIWGRQDPHVPREGRQLVYNAMCDAGVFFTWHEVNGQHAFLRDEGPRYDPELARIGYDLALALFQRRLTEGDVRIEASGTVQTKH